MKKSFKYRIHPNIEQRDKLLLTLSLCSDLYNTALEQRIKGYKLGYRVSFYTQTKELKSLRKDTEYSLIYAQVLGSVLKQLDTAYYNFFRRVKNGEGKVGFPRFKNRDRFNSITYPQLTWGDGCILKIENKRITIPKIGNIKIKYHREIQGTPKTLCIKRVNNKWFVILSCDNISVKDKITNITNKVGIDLGLMNFLTTSDNEKIDNPRHLKQSEDRIKELQVKLSSKHKGSNRRRKVKTLLSRTYEKVTNQRNDFLHKLSHWLINKYDLICYEDLKVKDMFQIENPKYIKHSINKSIGDVAWNKFIDMIVYKAEEAGKYAIPIDPKNTSKTCSLCGNIKEDLKLSDRTYHCDNCNIVLDRDYNASCNILRLGTSLFSNIYADKPMCFSHR